MTIQEAIEIVIKECPDDYAVAYAKAALEMNMEGKELKVQLLYIASNMMYWRGETARMVKVVLKEGAK